MNSDEVERVARALCKSHKLDPDRQIASMLDGQTSYPQWTAFSTHARAAIAAMSPVDRLREATDQMVSAGYLVAKKDGLTGPRHECERLVKLIIDAALSSPEPVGEVSDD